MAQPFKSVDGETYSNLSRCQFFCLNKNSIHPKQPTGPSTLSDKVEENCHWPCLSMLAPMKNEGESKLIIILKACPGDAFSFDTSIRHTCAVKRFPLINIFRGSNWSPVKHYWERLIDISPTRQQSAFKSTILNKRILICLNECLA